VAEKLRAGSVVLLEAGLGAGKTTFTKGIARGLRIGETVTSPTYTIVSEYLGRLPLHHVDLYRISGPQETEELGLREILGGPGVTVVEWGDRLGEEPEGAVRVRIEILGDQDRAFHFAGIDP